MSQNENVEQMSRCPLSTIKTYQEVGDDSSNGCPYATFQAHSLRVAELCMAITFGGLLAGLADSAISGVAVLLN